MPRAGVRAAVLAALLAVLTAFLPAGAHAAGPTLAGTAGFCPDASGVTVVVDFRELGGGRVVRCAPGGQPDGLAALRNAGFEVSGTSRWGDAFVCRINDRPGTDREPCVDTPPADAYWSYWHAENGGEWTYSQLGASYRTPPEGSFEGWSFSLDRESGDSPAPGVAPLRPAGEDETGGGSSGGGSSTGGDSGGTGGGSSSAGTGGTGGTGGQDGGAATTGGTGGQAETDPGGDATPPTEDADDQRPDGEEGEDGEEAEAEERRDAAEDDESTEATPGPAPSEAADWSGQDEEFEEDRAASESSGPSVSTIATPGLLAALVAAGGLAARRRRRTARTAGEQ